MKNEILNLINKKQQDICKYVGIYVDFKCTRDYVVVYLFQSTIDYSQIQYLEYILNAQFENIKINLDSKDFELELLFTWVEEESKIENTWEKQNG